MPRLSFCHASDQRECGNLHTLKTVGTRVYRIAQRLGGPSSILVFLDMADVATYRALHRPSIPTLFRPVLAGCSSGFVAQEVDRRPINRAYPPKGYALDWLPESEACSFSGTRQRERLAICLVRSGKRLSRLPNRYELPAE